MKARVLAVVLLGCAVVTAGCSNRPGDLTAAAEKVLAQKAQQVREIAATGNYDRLSWMRLGQDQP